MTVKELSRNELIELKQKYYSQKNNNVNYSEIASIDEIVLDSEVFIAYENVEFTEEDFFCNLDKEENSEIQHNYIEEEEEI